MTLGRARILFPSQRNVYKAARGVPICTMSTKSKSEMDVYEDSLRLVVVSGSSYTGFGS